MNEYFTRFIVSLTKRTRDGELHWENINPHGFEKYTHADKSLMLFFCENFVQGFYISFGTKGDEYVYEIIFSDSRGTFSWSFSSLSSNELDSDFDCALRELVDEVRFGRLKQLVEHLVEKKGKEGV